MKFALLLTFELRGLNKTIDDIYKYIVDFYDADIFIVCQKQLDDDETRLNLFNRNTVVKKLYDKPNPNDYFEKSFPEEDDVNMVAWYKYQCLQIYINLNEMAKCIEPYKNDYDYFIHFRTDIKMLFPLPDKGIFATVPENIYSFDFSYSLGWGGQGLGNFIHKKYIIDYLTSCYDFIKYSDLTTPLFTRSINIYDYLPEYKKYNYENNSILTNRKISQEFLLLLSLKEKNITMVTISNPNFYYTAELLSSRTTTSEINYDNKYDVIYKYKEQLDEAYLNLKLWNNNFRWASYNENIFLLNPNKIIDILIHNFNNGKFIEETIVSILKQKTLFNYDIIIIDDCSNDNSIEVIKKYADLFPDKIKIFQNKIRLGEFDTMMKLLYKKQSKYFMILNGDECIIDNNFINNAIVFMESNKIYTLYGNNVIKYSDSCSNTTVFEKQNHPLILDSDNLSIIPYSSSIVYVNNMNSNNFIRNINAEDTVNYNLKTIYTFINLKQGIGFIDCEKISGVCRVNIANIEMTEFYKKCFGLKYSAYELDLIDKNEKKGHLNKIETLINIKTILSINEDSNNYEQHKIIYSILLYYLEANNNKKIDKESFLFYNIDNYDYEYKYIFIRIIKLFSYLNKKLYYVCDTESYNKCHCYNENIINLQTNIIDIPEETLIILPYNCTMLFSTIKNTNIFYIGEFK